MMEWKELNLNIDDYEYDISFIRGKTETASIGEVPPVENVKIRYRKKPKAPTHEEIITKFWETDNKGVWLKPVGYWKGHYTLANTTFLSPVINKPKEWFIGRESADTPPEES